MSKQKCFVLIDLENYTPQVDEVRRARKEQSFHLKIFVGKNQKRIGTKLAAELQKLGGRVEYIFGNVVGRNANDLLIASHIGSLSAKHPGAEFLIVSRDTDFDSLIKNFTDIRIRRVTSLS